jgi:hypothetical protein
LLHIKSVRVPVRLLEARLYRCPLDSGMRTRTQLVVCGLACLLVIAYVSFREVHSALAHTSEIFSFGYVEERFRNHAFVLETDGQSPAPMAEFYRETSLPGKMHLVLTRLLYVW